MLLAVLTISDRCSRGEMTDTAGPAVVELLLGQWPEADIRTSLSPDDEGAIATELHRLCTEGAGLVLTVGGTGLGPRDRTPEALGALFERRLDGFGELFRALSFAEIGAAAMLSRADAGVVGHALVFLLPGSPAAVRLAMERLIVPELAHAVGQMRRASGRHVEAEGPHGHGGR